MSPAASARVRLRITLARHRRVVVAGLLALAVAASLQALRPPSPPTDPVVVATRDLPAGHRLEPSDLAVRPWPRGAAPTGMLRAPAGRVLASALRRGEPVTDVRVTAAGQTGRGGFGTTPVPPGWAAVTVRLTDPAAALLVTPGDRVQVIAGGPLDPLAAGSAAVPARVVADDAVVLAVPAPTASGGHETQTRGQDHREGGLLGVLAEEGATDAEGSATAGWPAGVLALGVSPNDALALAAAGGTRSLTVARQLHVSS